jgi:predicted nucleic acid-binding protein
MAIIQGLQAYFHEVGALLERSKASAYLDLETSVGCGTMLSHLGRDEGDEIVLVVLKNVTYLIVAREVGSQMSHHLARQIVEEIGVLIVAYIRLVNESSDEIVFEPGLRTYRLFKG